MKKKRFIYTLQFEILIDILIANGRADSLCRNLTQQLHSLYSSQSIKNVGNDYHKDIHCDITYESENQP